MLKYAATFPVVFLVIPKINLPPRAAPKKK